MLVGGVSVPLRPRSPLNASNQAPSTRTMSKAPSTSTASCSSSTNFEAIFTSALKEYKQKTKRDIACNPLAVQLQSCDSPSAVLDVLRARAQKLEQSQSANEKWTKWVDPIVNVLY